MGVVIRIESIDSAVPYSKTRAVEVGVPASVFRPHRRYGSCGLVIHVLFRRDAGGSCHLLEEARELDGVTRGNGEGEMKLVIAPPEEQEKFREEIRESVRRHREAMRGDAERGEALHAHENSEERFAHEVGA